MPIRVQVLHCVLHVIRKHVVYFDFLLFSLSLSFCEGPRSRCYGRTAALRLIVQPL
jgi:hypothetical protein